MAAPDQGADFVGFGFEFWMQHLLQGSCPLCSFLPGRPEVHGDRTVMALFSIMSDIEDRPF
jgi:hypothetical protein